MCDFFGQVVIGKFLSEGVASVDAEKMDKHHFFILVPLIKIQLLTCLQQSHVRALGFLLGKKSEKMFFFLLRYY